MKPVVFGTAGHIDHGKTALVAALTGVDCDRLPEERRRGITIALGFAPMVDPAGRFGVSFVDVPGHERLVHTMIAGAGGMDRALLVVAADEGVMPQTREHLGILTLLGVEGGVVALTKSDLVDGDLLVLRRAELVELLAGSPLAGAPVVACSARTGAGIDLVREAVLAAAEDVERPPDQNRPFRLAVDRVFTVAGAGTVVTGTALWGRVQRGDELTALPSGKRGRVRAVQVHGSQRPGGMAGERLALNLADFSVDEIPRGEQLLGKGPWAATHRVLVEGQPLPGEWLPGEGDRIWFHLLADRIPARVERLWPTPWPTAGQARLVLRLARPLLAVPGDRVILRRQSPTRTFGGGVVLDAHPPRFRRREAAQLATVPDPIRDAGAALAAWVRAAGAPGAGVDALAARLGVLQAALEDPLGRLLEAGVVLALPGSPPRLVASEVRRSVMERGAKLVRKAGASGIPVAELTARLLPGAPARLRDFYLAELRREGVMEEAAGRAAPAGSVPVEDPLAVRVLEMYRLARFEAPSPAEVARELRARPQVVEGLVRMLLARGRLVRVGGKWILHSATLTELVNGLRDWGVEVFDIGQFKERFGLTRKLAIPILEWLDTKRVTRRQGDRRRLLPVRPAGSGR